MFKRLVLFCTLFTLPAQAGTIDFEGLGDIAIVTSLSTSDNTVTFSCGAIPNSGNCGSFHYGGTQNVFVPNDAPNTGFGEGTAVGFVGLTGLGPGTTFDYFFQFNNAISSLGLDLIDHDFPGNVFTLALFSNADFTGFLGSVDLPLAGDATVAPIDLILSSSSALSASLTQAGNPERGIGIDNLRFTTAVPAPAVFTIMLLSLVFIAMARYRRVN